MQKNLFWLIHEQKLQNILFLFLPYFEFLKTIDWLLSVRVLNAFSNVFFEWKVEIMASYYNYYIFFTFCLPVDLDQSRGATSLRNICITLSFWLNTFTFWLNCSIVRILSKISFVYTIIISYCILSLIRRTNQKFLKLI